VRRLILTLGGGGGGREMDGKSTYLFRGTDQRRVKELSKQRGGRKGSIQIEGIHEKGRLIKNDYISYSLNTDRGLDRNQLFGIDEKSPSKDQKEEKEGGLNGKGVGLQKGKNHKRLVVQA